MKKIVIASILWATCGLVHAADVDANNIIEALKPKVSDGQMRTRSLRNLQVEQLRIEGHTDGKGTPEYNLTLSQNRADAVKKYLQRLGVTTERLETEGMGDKDLVNKADKFAAENRRVRIVTLTASK